MVRSNPKILRSLNGRLGYIRKQKGGGYMFVAKSTGKPAWKNLKKWELKSAKLYKE